MYTRTDRVRTTAVAPDWAGGAAAEKPCKVSVGTSIGRLSGYELAEREPGSGVFVGSILLAGFAELAHKTPCAGPFWATRGRGPDGGMLACMSDGREVAADAGGRSRRYKPFSLWFNLYAGERPASVTVPVDGEIRSALRPAAYTAVPWPVLSGREDRRPQAPRLRGLDRMQAARRHPRARRRIHQREEVRRTRRCPPQYCSMLESLEIITVRLT